MNWMSFLAVGAGGALGAMARYGVHRGLTAWHGAEAAWSTLAINIAGSFLLGLAAGALAGRPGHLSLFLMVGVMGAFTTFSTFALDAVALFRDRGVFVGGSYIGLSVFLAIIAFVVGVVLTKGNLS